jgi:NlpC/P60 family putative phage cell wall peptidase
MTRADVVADARLWLGTPYVHQASLRGVGSDCAGLTSGIPRDRGTPEGLAWAANRRAYGRVPRPDILLSSADQYADQIKVEEAGLGDVLLFRIFKEPQHFAIISSLDPVYIIHAWYSAGRVVENRLDDKWRGRIIRAYRYRGIV